MTITDAMREAAPAPLYPCKNEYCSLEHTFPADMLAWWRDGFYCDNCIDYGPDDEAPETEAEHQAKFDGPTLAAVLASQAPVAVARYLGDDR